MRSIRVLMVSFVVFLSTCTAEVESSTSSSLSCLTIEENSSAILKQACLDVPILWDEHARDIAKVRALRSWVSRWWPSSTSNITSVQDYWKVDPEELFLNGYGGRYGGACGSAAWMLMSVYDKFGLDAWIYNFGNPAGEGTHVVTLVKINGEIIVQDAFLNSELTGHGGVPLDVRLAISAISESASNGFFAPVNVLYETSVRRCITVIDDNCNNSWLSRTSRRISEQRCTYSGSDPSYWICEISNFVGSDILHDERWWNNVSDFLRQSGMTPGYTTLMLHPINLTGTNGIAIFEPGDGESESQDLFNEIYASIYK